MKLFSRLGILGLVLSCALGVQPRAFAQDKDDKSAEKKTEKPAESAAPKEESSVTEHTIKIGGQTIPYKATAQTILLKDDKGEPTALLYSTAYTRSDVKDPGTRPIAFLYNGGPGSSSVWLHMGSFGPKRVVTVNAGVTPPAPYKAEDNAYCLLDKADLVFVDPIGTGFSHAVGKAQNKDFWGVDQDVKSLAQFINLYIKEQPVEFAKISHRRKLRNIPLRGARELLAGSRQHVPERNCAGFFGAGPGNNFFSART